MWWIVGAIVGLPIIVIVLVMVTTVSSLQKLAGATVAPIGTNVDHRAAEVAAEHGSWTERQKMRFLGFFGLTGGSSIRLLAWQLSEPVGYFVVYLIPGRVYFEYVSIISETEGTSLTTTSTKDALTVREATGSYVQCFTDCPADRLLTKHVAGMQYLKMMKRVDFQSPQLPFPQVLVNCVQRQVSHVRGNPLYPLETVYRYFVGRHTRANKSIQDQLL